MKQKPKAKTLTPSASAAERALRHLNAIGRQRGYVTDDEFESCLQNESVEPESVESVLAALDVPIMTESEAAGLLTTIDLTYSVLGSLTGVYHTIKVFVDNRSGRL